MLPLRTIELRTPANAKPGEFLLPVSRSEASSRLVMRSADSSQVECLVIAKQDQGVRTTLGNMARTASQFFVFEGAEITVDKSSVVLGTKEMPSTGTLMMTASGPGVLFSDDRVFFLDGRIDLVDWGNDVGFSKWSVALPQADGTFQTLIEIDAPPA